MNTELKELIQNLTEELSNVAGEQYVNEPDWNESAHVGKITLTVKDARILYKLNRQL